MSLEMPEQDKKPEMAVDTVLRNDLLLRSILDYLPLSVLLKTRLVNSYWKKLASNTVTLKRYGTRFWKVFYVFFDNDGGLKNGNFKQFWNFVHGLADNVESPPCTRFLVEDSFRHNRILPKDWFARDMLAKELYPIISQFATELIFCHRPSNPWLWNDSRITYPKLRAVTFQLLPTNLPMDLEERVNDFIKVVKNSPNLKFIKFRSKLVRESGPLNVFLVGLNCPVGQQIKHLELAGLIENRSLELLDNLNLKLKSFSITFSTNSSFDKENLKKFLESQCECLESLKVENFNLRESVTVKFPQMWNVRTLQLVSFSFYGKPVHYIDFSFAKQFPALVDLSLFQGDLGNLACLFKRCSGPMTKVKVLNLMESEYDPDLLPKIVQFFPYVCHLTIKSSMLRMDSPLFSMKHVEHLVLRGDDTEKAMEAMTYKTGVDKQYRYHHSSFLKQLKTIKIWGGNMTETAGYKLLNGPCEKLQRLDLYKSVRSRLSDKLLKQMRQKFSVYCFPEWAFPKKRLANKS